MSNYTTKLDIILAKLEECKRHNETEFNFIISQDELLTDDELASLIRLNYTIEHKPYIVDDVETHEEYIITR